MKVSLRGRIESAFRKGLCGRLPQFLSGKFFLMSEAYLHMPAGHISQPRMGYIIPHTATPYIILYLAPGRQIVYNMDNKGRGERQDASVYHQAGPAPGKSTRIGEEMRRLRQAGKTVYYLVPEQYSFEMERRYYADDILVYSMNGWRTPSSAGAAAWPGHTPATHRPADADAGDAAGRRQRPFAPPEERWEAGVRGGDALPPGGANAGRGRCRGAGRGGPFYPPRRQGRGDALPLKLRDLALIFEGYGAALSRSFLDPSARLSRAVEKAAENGFFDGAYVFVDEYKSFTGVQLQMLAVIIRQAKSVSVALCDDPSRQGDALFEGGAGDRPEA